MTEAAISTIPGTPAGVGPIRDGDVVKIEFDRIGSMTLNVIQGQTGRYSLFTKPPQG